MDHIGCQEWDTLLHRVKVGDYSRDCAEAVKLARLVRRREKRTYRCEHSLPAHCLRLMLGKSPCGVSDRSLRQLAAEILDFMEGQLRFERATREQARSACAELARQLA